MAFVLTESRNCVLENVLRWFRVLVVCSKWGKRERRTVGSWSHLHRQTHGNLWKRCRYSAPREAVFEIRCHPREGRRTIFWQVTWVTANTEVFIWRSALSLHSILCRIFHVQKLLRSLVQWLMGEHLFTWKAMSSIDFHWLPYTWDYTRQDMMPRPAATLCLSEISKLFHKINMVVKFVSISDKFVAFQTFLAGFIFCSFSRNSSINEPKFGRTSSAEVTVWNAYCLSIGIIVSHHTIGNMVRNIFILNNFNWTMELFVRLKSKSR